MKRLAQLGLIMLFGAMLQSCADDTTIPAEGMVTPGDRIGDLLVTQGEGEDVVYLSTIHCPYDNDSGTESCEFPAGTHVNVAVGIYDDDPSTGKSLDEYWTEQTYEMMIEGRRVSLGAFGSIDLPHPMFGTIRIWNVVVTSDKPGKVSARSTGTVGGDPFDYTGAVTFSSP